MSIAEYPGNETDKIATLAELARHARDDSEARRDALEAARMAYDAARAAALAADAEWRGLLTALDATLARLPHEPDQPPVLPFALPFRLDDAAHYRVGSQSAFPIARDVVRGQEIWRSAGARRREQDAA